jgi:hypothetical protein
MIEIQAPQKDPGSNLPRLFLGGSIEMGIAERWQDKIITELTYDHVIIFNPRRDDWDSSINQSINDPRFYEQVDWEMRSLDSSDIIIFYFDPNTKSPVTLLELGLHAGSWDKKIIVCCPDGFWRKGNVEMVCERYSLTLVDNFNELLIEIKDAILDANIP